LAIQVLPRPAKNYLANICTVLDVFFNFCLHSFPPVSSLDLLVGFASAKMSSSGGVIVTGEQDSWNSISGTCFNISVIQGAVFHIERFNKSPKIRLLVVTILG